MNSPNPLNCVFNEFSRHRQWLHFYAALIVTTAFAVGCTSGKPVSTIFNGLVTKVHDGDSIHVTPPGEKRVIIRLGGIDAPEIKQQDGIKSRDFLRKLILNKRVTARCDKVDRYNRQVCVVLINDINTNLEMLKNGHAWYYERFKNEQSRIDQYNYRKAAKKARKEKLGLWQNSSAIAPWNFRALK